MIRKFNYTGRQKIKQSKIQISVHDDGKNIRSFNAEFSFDELGFNPDSKIYVEPYYRSSFMRFDFGTIDKIVVPPNRKINDIPHNDFVLFRVKIVDESGTNGKILGLADRIRPFNLGDDEKDRQTILWVDFNVDLDQQIWRLSFDGEMPLLEVNRQIDNRKELARSKPFFSLVYPSIIREIATKLIAEYNEFEEDGIEWQNLWLGYFSKVLRTRKMPLIKEGEDLVREEWIDEVASAFCRKNRTRNKLETISSEL